MFPPFDQFSSKDIRKYFFTGIATMLFTGLTAIGLKQLAAWLKRVDHKPLSIIIFTFPILFLLGCALILYGFVSIALIERKPTKGIGIALVFFGMGFLFLGFFYS